MYACSCVRAYVCEYVWVVLPVRLQGAAVLYYTCYRHGNATCIGVHVRECV